MNAFLVFASGLGIFLLAMKQLEQSLKRTAGARLQKSIAEKTDTPIEAIFTGTISTALLQSSSLVGLIALALCGAGMLPLFNAIGVMVGANLGTTFTGWIVTWIGFKLNLSEFAFYMVGFSGIVYISVINEWLKNVSSSIIALGLLLIGLNIMKESSAGVADHVDVEAFRTHSIFYFLALGIFLSAVIQSSSAVMMITLSALNINVIELTDAAALVIGADLGTTSTVLLGAIKGAGIKKQLAAAHLIFNVVTDVIAFVFLLPFINQILHFFGIADPLYSLVAFHSLFNLVGIVLFFPFIKRFANFLSARIKDSATIHSHFINKVPTEIPNIAIKAVENEVSALICRMLKSQAADIKDLDSSRKTTYQHLKAIEGEILSYTRKLQTKRLTETQIDDIAHLKEAARMAIFSFKSLNDVEHDLQNLYQLKINATSMQATRNLIKALEDTIHALLEILDNGVDNNIRQAKFEDLHVELKLQHQKGRDWLYSSELDEEFNSEEISSLLNLNREIFNAGKYAVLSIEQLYSI